MQTRAKNHIHNLLTKLSHITLHSLASYTKPTSFSATFRHPKWQVAMSEKFNVLLHDETWTLVVLNPSQNLVSYKWHFVLKETRWHLKCYKSCLFAKGFHHWPGTDYHETFTPVVKPTIRLVHSIALSEGWSAK